MKIKKVQILKITNKVINMGLCSMQLFANFSQQKKQNARGGSEQVEGNPTTIYFSFWFLGVPSFTWILLSPFFQIYILEIYALDYLLSIFQNWNGKKFIVIILL